MAHDAEAFKEKLRAWREGEASFGVTWGGRNGNGTRKDFHDEPSKFQKERDIIDGAKAKGTQLERYDPSLTEKTIKKQRRIK